MRARCLSALLPLLLLLAGPALAKLEGDEHAWCGTSRSSLAVALGIHHDDSERARRGDDLPRPEHGKNAMVPQAASRAGNLAVLEDDGTIIQRPNPVDVGGSALELTRAGKAERVAIGHATLTDAIGTRLDLGDDDSRLVKFGKGFRFPFFKKNYTSVFVNSDGNLTFTEGDNQSTARDLQRLLNGPPRIAAFFTDLNPSTASGDGGVYVNASSKQVIVTWLDVPQFDERSNTILNTFQVTLYKNGRITIAYGDLHTQEAVVGVAAGGGGSIDLVDLQANLPKSTTNAIAEIFGTGNHVDDLAIAQMFFHRFADVYDHLVVWLDFPYDLGGGAFAYEFPIKNEIKGIGQPIFDFSKVAGSKGRLRSFVQMGSLETNRYPLNPDQTFLGTNSTLDILGQETGHRWLAFLGFKDGSGQVSDRLLGRALAHWSFLADSDASDMEGNKWDDHGNGSFTTVESTTRYSPLDLYVMGLIGPDQVPDFFFIDSGAVSRGAPPEEGVGITGTRVDVRLADVIRAEGPRVPNVAKAPHAFTMAFVIVEPAGKTPTQAVIDQVEGYRTAWESYFARATGNHGSVDTTLRDR